MCPDLSLAGTFERSAFLQQLTNPRLSLLPRKTFPAHALLQFPYSLLRRTLKPLSLSLQPPDFSVTLCQLPAARSQPCASVLQRHALLPLTSLQLPDFSVTLCQLPAARSQPCASVL